MPSQAGDNKPSSSGRVHRMLDVPRGCALSPGGSGRASETAQVRGLGYPVSRRPAAGTPAPDTPQSQAWQARHSLDSGHACSRLAPSTLGEEIWRGRSMAICRSGAYLRGSYGLPVREAVSRADAGPQDTCRKSGYLRLRLLFWDFCATVLLCLASRYLLSLGGYPRREVGLRLKCFTGLAPRVKPQACNVTSDWCKRSAPFPKRELWSSLRRLATHYQVCDGPPESPPLPLHLIFIRLNHWPKALNFKVVQAAFFWPRPLAERWPFYFGPSLGDLQANRLLLASVRTTLLLTTTTVTMLLFLCRCCSCLASFGRRLLL